MRALLVGFLLLLGTACGEGQARFLVVDVWADVGEARLAAYQLELRCGSAVIVGIEGGTAKHFTEPPRYDPAALQGGRVILAAFTTELDPPTGRVLVARVHLLEHGPVGGPYQTLGITAADPSGARIPAEIELVPVGDD